MRCQWQIKHGERVAAVKISSARRKAAQKFWAPQQEIRYLKKCGESQDGRYGGIAAEIDTKRWCGANPDRCYSGIAAEIDTKNMPLAYFLNVSTPACFLNVSTSVTGSE